MSILSKSWCLCNCIAILSSKWKATNRQLNGKDNLVMRGMNRNGKTQENLAMTSNCMQLKQARQTKHLKMTQCINILASRLTKTRVLKFAKEQIQNQPAQMTDCTFKNLKVYP